MSHFAGFPPKMDFTPVPNLFFVELLPQIEDCHELKVTLYIFWLIYRKKGYPRFASYTELLGEKALLRGLGEGASDQEASLRQALKLATERGTLLHLALERPGAGEDIYLQNNQEGREALAAIKNGAVKLDNLLPIHKPEAEAPEKPNIFSLYEQNVGLLTPIIAEELQAAEKAYPAFWIEEAFKEAVALNKRSWRYIVRILERWSREGKDSGEVRGYPEKETDPDKYIRGKYGRLVKR